jgi:transposase
MLDLGGIVLSTNEQQSFEIIRKVELGKLDKGLACKLLDVSIRTLYRYIKNYRTRGLMFLRHGNRAKKPANAYPYEIRAAVQKIVLEALFDFNMSHAREIIEKKFDLKIPRETFRRWCHQINAVKHKQKRRVNPRYKRTRQSQMGLMIQFDGSYHKWFAERKSCLIAGIDDASSTIVGAQFGRSENIFECMEVLKSIVENYGIFRVLYVDRAGLYGGMKRRGFSQIVRALAELGIQVIYAQSPEGKGRVERLFRTLQDRLIPELRINKIHSIELANRYLKNVYVPDHNRRFSVATAEKATGFISIDPQINLTDIFCIKINRKVAKDHTVSVNGDKWLIKHPNKISISNRRIEFRIYPDDIKAHFLKDELILEKIASDRKNVSTVKVAG